MVKIREELDANRAETARQETTYPTDRNNYEAYCDMCGEVFFVDELMYEKVRQSLDEGFDNPFLCTDCRDELGDEAYL